MSGTGPTNYTATPWGLFTQQQFILHMAYEYLIYNYLDPSNPSEVIVAIEKVTAYYGYAWPAVESMVL